MRTWSGSAWRTAAVSTAGMPAASASPRSRAACDRHPGVPSRTPVEDDLDGEPVAGQERCHAARRSRARSRRPASTARPTSESGPRSTSSRLGPSAGRGDTARGSVQPHLDPPTSSPGRGDTARGSVQPHLDPPTSSPASPSGCDHRASRSGVVTGMPRSPRRWVSVTSRHSAAQPTPSAGPPPRPRASTVTRGRRGSTMAPPRTGVRGRAAGRPASGRVGASGSTARSTPSTGATPARPHAVAKRTAP